MKSEFPTAPHPPGIRGFLCKGSCQAPPSRRCILQSSRKGPSCPPSSGHKRTLSGGSQPVDGGYGAPTGPLPTLSPALCQASHWDHRAPSWPRRIDLKDASLCWTTCRRHPSGCPSPSLAASVPNPFHLRSLGPSGLQRERGQCSCVQSTWKSRKNIYRLSLGPPAPHPAPATLGGRAWFITPCFIDYDNSYLNSS